MSPYSPLPRCSKSGAQQLTHLTALVFLPPPEIQTRLNALRSAHDRSFPRFTAHITLPFVEQPDLDAAVERLRSTLSEAPLKPFNVVLDRVQQFRGRHNVTVYLSPDSATTEHLCRAAQVLMRAFGLREDKGRPFAPHLTLGQAPHSNAPIELLTQKAKRLLKDRPLSWTLSGFVFLRKDIQNKDLIMRPYAFVPFDGETATYSDCPNTSNLASPFVDPRHFPTYAFCRSQEQWIPTEATQAGPPGGAVDMHIAACDLSKLSGSMNCVKPRALLTGEPSVLVLHGMTDDMLQGLLCNSHIRAHFTWCSYGTHSVMPAERNVVVFAVSSLPFEFTPLGSSSLTCRFAAGTLAVLNDCNPSDDPSHSKNISRHEGHVVIVRATAQRTLLHLDEPPGFTSHMDPQLILHPRDPAYCIMVNSSHAEIGNVKFRRGALGCGILASVSIYS